MVYGDFKKNKAYETDQLNPKEIYGTMKLAGEIVTKGLCNFIKYLTQLSDLQQFMVQLI